jgi:thiamine biosynthesis protein ThiS
LRLRLNGEEHESDAATLAELLRGLDLPDEGVAVAVNAEVVPRAERSRALREGDRVEVIRAVGGG